MARLLFSVFALLVSLVLLISGSALLGTLLAVRLSLEGFSASTVGVVMATYSIGFVAGSLYAIHVVRSVGHIRAFAAFAALAAAAVLVHPLAVNAELWIALRLVVGFSLASLMLVVESWLNDRATTANRGMLMGSYMMLFYLASAVGQFLFAVADPAGFVLFILVAILFALALVPVSLTRAVAPLASETSLLSPRALFEISPVGLIGSFVTGIVIAAFLALGPVFASQMGFGGRNLALFMGIAVLGAMVFQWPVGYLSNYLNRRAVIAGLAVLGAGASGTVAFVAPWSTEAKLVAVFVFMGFAASAYPVSVALTHDYMENHQITSASAGLLLSFGVGTIVGPLGAALFMEWLGARGLFAFTGLVLMVLGGIAIYRVRYYPSIEVTEQEQFVPTAPVTTPVLVELDPRNEEFEAGHPDISDGEPDGVPDSMPSEPPETPDAPETERDGRTP